LYFVFFFFQAEDGIRDFHVTGVQTCALPISECPEVKVLEQQTANWSRAEAQTLMENWLTAHQGQINGVIGQNDEMALGAIEAIRSEERRVGKECRSRGAQYR